MQTITQIKKLENKIRYKVLSCKYNGFSDHNKYMIKKWQQIYLDMEVPKGYIKNQALIYCTY
jgi:hypothetical protein